MPFILDSAPTPGVQIVLKETAHVCRLVRADGRVVAVWARDGAAHCRLEDVLRAKR